MINPHLLALLEATLVTILWSSSFVLIKWGLEELPPFLFAGLRYFGGFLVLLAFALALRRQGLPQALGLRRWAKLVGVGIAAYTLGNGFLFLSLTMIPAVTASFIQGLIPLLVAILGVLHLRERPSLLQAGGIGLALVGAYIFFPLDAAVGQAMGIVIALGAALSFAYQMILVRDLSRDGVPGPLWLTIISLGIGGGLLFLPGAFEPLPRLTMTGIAILLWLVVVNTAFAYLLWNHALEHLKAFEQAMVANTMPLQIALWAWLFLGEELTLRMVIGLVVVVFGVFVVQADQYIWSLLRRLGSGRGS